MIAVGLESAREIEPNIVAGPVAQWITRLTTDQKIPGSNPGRFGDPFQQSKLRVVE